MSLRIEIPQFPTHLAKTNNKQAPNKYVKVNGQLIYSGNLNKFARGIVMDNMHEFLMQHIPELRQPLQGVHKVTLEVHSPINYDTVSRRKLKDGKFHILWKHPKADYIPRWDLDNFSWIWMKAFLDAAQKNDVLLDDSVEFVRELSVKYVTVPTLEDRKLVFTIEKR